MTPLDRAPSTAHRILGVVLSLAVMLVLGSALVLFAFALMRPDGPVVRDSIWAIALLALLFLIAVWLLTRLVFTRPKRLETRGLYAVAVIFAVCATCRVVLGAFIGWDGSDMKLAIVAAGFVLVAFGLARRRRDA